VHADLIEVYKIVDGHFFILLRLIISLNLTSLDEQGVILLRVMKTAMSTGPAAAFLLGKGYNFVDEQTVASTSVNCFKSNLTRLIDLFLDNSVQRP